MTNAAVRMYRMGELGDCLLLTFTAGASTSRMLVDCGSFRNGAPSTKRLAAVTDHIRRELRGAPLDVVIGTHQHNDHVNGFVHCEKTFRKMGVDQVWLSWLDDPQDRLAHDIGKTYNNFKLALAAAGQQLRGLRGTSQGRRPLQTLDDMLGFFAAKGPTKPPVQPEKAFAVLKSLGQQKPRYLRPGQVLDLPGLPPGSVRVYVLGPPRDDELLYRKDPRTGESYDLALAAAHVSLSKLAAAARNRDAQEQAGERNYPFDDVFKRRPDAASRALQRVMARYHSPEQRWRRIDTAWLEQAATLALFLDTFTNNSSVVVAIELVASGKVLLFAGDAQIGSWLSWADVPWQQPGVTTDDLLARTVLYKVGHHGSHNATLVAALEKMSHPDLMALIPVDKNDANIKKPDGWKMPARNLYRRLQQLTSNRVLRMDCANPPSCNPNKSPAREAWLQAGAKTKTTSLFVEVQFS